MTESLVLVLRGTAVLYQTSKEATMESEHVLRQFTKLYAELQAFLHEGGPQISVRSSHLSRDLSDSWTSFTQFTLFSEKPPEGYTWTGRRLIDKKASDIQARSFMARTLERNVKERFAEGEA